MKTKLSKLLFFPALATLLFCAGCSGGGDSGGDGGKSDLLIGTWYITGGSITVDGDKYDIPYSEIAGTSTFTFYADKTYHESQPGGVYAEGTWELVSGGKKLRCNDRVGGLMTFDVVELTSQSFIWGMWFNEDGMKYYMEATYSRGSRAAMPVEMQTPAGALESLKAIVNANLQ